LFYFEKVGRKVGRNWIFGIPTLKKHLSNVYSVAKAAVLNIQQIKD